VNEHGVIPANDGVIPANRRPETVPQQPQVSVSSPNAPWFLARITSPLFLSQVYDLCDERMFNIEATPCWTSHPDIVLEFLCIIMAREGFQDQSIVDNDPLYGLKMCEYIESAFHRITNMLARCIGECEHHRRRTLHTQLQGKDLKEIPTPPKVTPPVVFSTGITTTQPVQPNAGMNGTSQQNGQQD